MANASDHPESKQIVNSVAKSDEFAIKILAKSDSPKTLKENIQLLVNLFINFFS